MSSFDVESSITISNTKALSEDLMLIQVLDKEAIDVGNSVLDIDRFKQRLKIFLDNNLLLRYLIECEQFSDDDRSNRASAIRLMKENLEYQDHILALKAKDIDTNELRKWAQSLLEKRKQINVEISQKNDEVVKHEKTIDSSVRFLKNPIPMLKSSDAEQMKQSLADTETTAAQLKTEVKHLQEQLGEIRHNVQQLSQIAKETAPDGDCDSADSTADIDQQLKEVIEEANRIGQFGIKPNDKYQWIDLWRRMRQWEKTFTQKEVALLGWLSFTVIDDAIRDSFDKFIEVHIKPTKDIQYSSVNNVFRNGKMERAVDFVKEAEKFHYWRMSLYYLRGYLRWYACVICLR